MLSSEDDNYHVYWCNNKFCTVNLECTAISSKPDYVKHIEKNTLEIGI